MPPSGNRCAPATTGTVIIKRSNNKTRVSFLSVDIPLPVLTGLKPRCNWTLISDRDNNWDCKWREKNARTKRTAFMGGRGSHRPNTGPIFSDNSSVYKYPGTREPQKLSLSRWLLRLAGFGFHIAGMRGNGRDLLVVASSHGRAQAWFILLTVPVEYV